MGKPKSTTKPVKPAFSGSVSKIKQIILKMPYRHLLSEIRRARGCEELPVEVQRRRAEEQICRLAFEAGIGEADAVIALRDLGLLIATHLEALVGDPEDVVSAVLVDEQLYLEDVSDPEQDIDLHQHPLNQQIAHLAEADGDTLRELIEKQSKVHDVYDYVLEDVFGEPDPDTTSPRPSKEGDSDTVDQIESPGMVLAEKFAQILIGQRVRHVARRVVRRVAGESLEWPITVPAVADKRAAVVEADVANLNLGSLLGTRFSPKPGKGGTRMFKAGSQARFALDIWVVLEKERQLCAASTGRAEALRALRVRDRERTDIDRLANMRWRVDAGLLPKFSGNPEVLAEWEAVAMAWAEARCSGNWVDFAWPKCVVSRISYSEQEQRLRHVRATVAEKIHLGFKMLVRDDAAAH